MVTEGALRLLSNVLGWTYVLCWCASFLTQLLLNATTRSVTGVSADFVVVNACSMLCYGVYVLAHAFSLAVRNEYRMEHAGNESLVRPNDVVFVIALNVMSVALVAQYAAFHRPSEGPSCAGIGASLVATLAIVVGPWAVYSGTARLLPVLTALGYVKVVFTAAKYVPQVMHNWRRRSTAGWSIRNVLLDFTGGLLSIVQLALDAYIAADAGGVGGLGAKFALGAVSVGFDVIFALQHYVWFSEPRAKRFIAVA